MKVLFVQAKGINSLQAQIFITSKCFRHRVCGPPLFYSYPGSFKWQGQSWIPDTLKRKIENRIWGTKEIETLRITKIMNLVVTPTKRGKLERATWIHLSCDKAWWAWVVAISHKPEVRNWGTTNSESVQTVRNNGRMTLASSLGGHHLYSSLWWAMTPRPEWTDALLRGIRFRYFYYGQFQSGSLTEISETLAWLQNSRITPWACLEASSIKWNLQIFSVIVLRKSLPLLLGSLYIWALSYIMWTQLTSSSWSLHFVWRLHFSLRLPDTLGKGSNHCLPGLRSMTWQVTFSFSSHSPPRRSQPMAVVAAHWLLVPPQSCRSDWSQSPLALSYMGQVLTISIWSLQIWVEKEENLSKTLGGRQPSPQRDNLALFLPFRPLSPHPTLNHHHTNLRNLPGPK